MFLKPLTPFLLGGSFLILSACGGGGSTPAPTGGLLGGGSSSQPTTTTPPISQIESKSEAAKFIAYAAFGSSDADQATLNGTDATDWLQAQFAKPYTPLLPPLSTRFEAGEALPNNAARTAHWDAMISSEDELRQRMIFALSQILVVSDKSMSTKPLRMAHYMDILGTHAFGNYRDLLEDVTYSPAMGRYLTYHRNRKGNSKTGRMPDENYARELLQLFTVGLVSLNMDGTPKLDENGKQIELFTNEDIVGLAKVFTGLSNKGSTFWSSGEAPNADYSKMQAFDDQHSPLEKQFMGKTIPAGTMTVDSIDQALDHIFAQDSLPPFISRQLIQRFTASHPEPAYVERVATAFVDGRFTSPNGETIGTGERGDLKATLAAILLDESIIDPNIASANTGKIREPILRFVHWAKAFDVKNINSANERWLAGNSGSSARLSQQAFSAPSVFNFYRPGYVAPNTETGKLNLTAPEFQIGHDGATVGYINFMGEFIRNRSSRYDETVDSFEPDYSAELALADEPEALAEHLNALLLAGQMNEKTKDRMVSILNAIPLRETERDADTLTRVEVAIMMSVTDPAFIIQR